MKQLNMVALALGAVLMATPVIAGAAQGGGTVCGRVDAPSSYIFQLEQSPTHDNVIFARSQSEVVKASVNLDGSFCLTGLNSELHTLTAFSDVESALATTVRPVEGRTLQVELTGASVTQVQ